MRNSIYTSPISESSIFFTVDCFLIVNWKLPETDNKMTSRKQKESPKKTQISVTEEEKCSSDCDSAHQRRDKIIQDATAAIGDIRAKEKTKKKVDEKAVTSKVFAMTRSRSKDIQVTHESLPSKLSRQRNTILKTATESLKNVAPKKAGIHHPCFY